MNYDDMFKININEDIVCLLNTEEFDFKNIDLHRLGDGFRLTVDIYWKPPKELRDLIDKGLLKEVE